MEDGERELKVEDNGFLIDLGPCQIKTLKMSEGSALSVGFGPGAILSRSNQTPHRTHDAVRIRPIEILHGRGERNGGIG